jgi:hypothetical protein
LQRNGEHGGVIECVGHGQLILAVVVA